MKSKILFLFLSILFALPIFAEEIEKDKGLSALQNRIKQISKEQNIQNIKISVYPKKNSVTLVIIYNEQKKEVTFSKAEIENAKKGLYSSSTQAKFKYIFNMSMQPGGGGPPMER